MKKLYIKFEEKLENGKILNEGSPSLEEACKEAEWLGYEIYYHDDAIELEGHGILGLSEHGEYWTSLDSCKDLEKYGYTEHKIETNGLKDSIYMVFLPGRGAPTREHKNIEQARAEAKRLFKEHGIEGEIVMKIEKLKSKLSFSKY